MTCLVLNENLRLARRDISFHTNTLGEEGRVCTCLILIAHEKN